jgi:DNA-binding HxlR family transcriptional regulator
MKAVRAPGRREQIALRLLAKERTARAIEIHEAAGGALPRDHVWTLMRRLRDRGAIKVVRRVDTEHGRCPVYGLTAYGHRVLRALQLLESGHG